MQVDRHIELFGALVDRPEPLVVLERVVREPMDHGALEAELDGAFELVGGGRRIARGQRREGAEALRVGRDHGVEPVVDAARQRDRSVAAELLGRRRAVGEHLHVDADFVHLLEAPFAEIVETLLGVAAARRFDAGKGLGQFGIPVVLLERDDRTVRFFHHDAASRLPLT